MHTFVWALFYGLLCYLFYAAFIGKIDIWVWICISLILMEGLILLIFRANCPLTLMARRYSNSNKENFDIFLPNWLAKYNKLIYISLLLIALILIFVRK